MKINVLTCVDCAARFETTRRADTKRCDECRRTKNWRLYQSRPEERERRRAEYRAARDEVIAGYGGKCACCGEAQREFLAIDHVLGGGRAENTKVHGLTIMKRIIAAGFPDKYRILCHNCNQSLGWFGYCPHEKRTA